MIVKTDAIVVRSMRFRDTSRIVTFYTRRYGKVSAVAKGARNLKSKFGAALEPMTGVALVLYKKEQRELQLVSQCDIVKPYKRIHTEMERMAPAMAILELLHQLTHDEEEHAALYRLVEQTLDALEHAEKNHVNYLYAFELRVAALFGFAPVLTRCVRCGTAGVLEGPEDFVHFRLDKGGILCRACLGASGEFPSMRRNVRKPVLRILDRLFVADLRSLGGLEYQPVVGNEMDELLRSYLQYHFEDLRPLRSERVFRALTS